MTYTYKLARRLAISQNLSMVSALLLIAACAGDTTGPESTGTSQSASPGALTVVPTTVTIETNQKIRFRSQSPDGKRFSSALTWKSTGGTISSAGIFSASQPGTYKVVGRGRGKQKPDTSIVVVVPPQPDLVAVKVAPDTVALNAGETHTFSAAGLLSDGTTAAIGVTWSATGGTVDAGGVYTAGDVAGKYRIVAIKSAGTLADTAAVTLTVPESPAPEPEPPAPTLAEVFVTPASVSLITGKTKQFAAYGRNSLGDSVAVAVAFTATGGTITSSGLFTAGSTTGTYRVVAAASGMSDTAVVTLTPSTAPGGTVGLPFGPSQQLSRAGGVYAPFSMTSDAYTAGTIVNQIAAARAGRYTLLLNMTGGPHNVSKPGDYLSVINGVLQFDEAKWRAKMDTYNTAAIRQAVADGVRDGIIVGNIVMDEPNVSGGGDGNTWGPKGTMTKARVDGLCGYVKQIFPTLPAGVAHQHNVFEQDKSYRICDFIVDQYNYSRGNVTTFRDDGLALGRRDGHAIMFSLNILDGGVQDRDGTYDCTGAGQAGKGTFAPNCRMTAQQVRDWGQLLGPAGCGLFMWRYDDAFAARVDNQEAFKAVGARMATVPSKSCRRS